MQSDKDVTFYKRYVDGKKFSNEKRMKVDVIKMSHGDFFVLHPDDEHVFERRVQSYNGKYKKEGRKSQFQHGVVCKTTRNKKARHNKGYKLSISVCFCESKQTQEYDNNSNLIFEATKDNKEEATPKGLKVNVLIGDFSKGKPS